MDHPNPTHVIARGMFILQSVCLICMPRDILYSGLSSFDGRTMLKKPSSKAKAAPKATSSRSRKRTNADGQTGESEPARKNKKSKSAKKAKK